MAASKPAADPLAALAAKSQSEDLTAKELSALADIWLDMQTQRLAADKVAAALKTKEESAKSVLLAQFQKQGLTGIGGKTVRVGMDPNPEYTPAVKDWTKFYAYIKKNDAWELLERRPGRVACRERWEDGKTIPGVEKFPVYKLTKQGV